MADDLRQREPRVEDKAFLAFVRTHRCAACGAPPPNHAAHIRMACPALGKRSVGTAEKPDDRWAVGLCRECHQDGPQAQHKGSEAAFWRRVRVDPFAVAQALYEAFTTAKATGFPKRPSQIKRATDSGAKVRRPKKGVRPLKRRVAFRGKNQVSDFTFAADKLKPKMKWPKRQLSGTMKFPKGRKMRSKR